MKKLNKGLRRDEKALDQPEGSWRDARNIVLTKANGSVANENGFDNITPTGYPTDKKVIGVIQTNTKKVHFFATTSAADSEIGIVDENLNYTPIIIDALLNFHEDHPIQGAFQIKFNDNLIIAWTDSTQGKWNPYRILNLDCLPFGIEPDYSITPADLEKAKALLSLFPEIKSPIISDINVLESGGALITGAYFPIVAYTLADGTDTSWVGIYNPISITSNNISTQAFGFSGNLGGEFTGKALAIDFTDLDTNYKYLKFGYIKLENGVYSAQYVNSYLINGSTLSIEFTDGEPSKSDLTLDEVLIPNAIYPYGKTITSVLNKLFLGNVESEVDFDYQPYANNIELKWIYEKDVKTYELLVSESYKKEKVIYFNKAFKSDEVYAFYIGLKNKKTGKWTKAFTLPGRTINAGDDTDISGTDVDIAELDSGNPIPKFRVLETATVTTVTADPAKPANANNLEGEFGYWENEIEEYPDVPSFDSSGLGGLDLRTEKVRHHKFPSANLLIDNQPVVDNNGFNYVENKDELSYNGTFVNAGQVFSLLLTPTTNDIGWLNGTLGSHSIVNDPAFLAYGNVKHNQIFYFIKNKLKIKIHFKVTFAASAFGLSLTFRIFKNSVQYFEMPFTIPAGGGSENLYAEFPVEDGFATGSAWGAGYLHNFTILMEAAGSPSAPVISSCTGSLILHDLERSASTTKCLGIKVSNVVIPAGLEETYDEWGIFYAKRTSSNIRALGNDTVKHSRLHTFDLMQKQVATKASYLKSQLMYFDNEAGDLTNNYPYPEREYLFNRTRIVTPKVYHIRRFEYAGENTNLNGIDNTTYASNIYIEAGKSFTTPYDATELQDTLSKTNTLVDLLIYKKSVYESFQKQELVFTGQTFKITSSGIQADQKVYGGDIFNTYHGFLEGNVGVGLVGEHSSPVEAAANIGLRMDDLVLGKYYYPKHFGYEAIKPTVSYYGYNTDYSALNDLTKIFPATYEDGCYEDIYVFPQRIPYSLTEGNESNKINWRIFKINDYYEMPKNKGVIWNLLGNDRVLYIHHEYSLFIAQIKDRLNTSGEETYLGISDLFDRPPVEVMPVKEGYAGNTSQFATIVCKLGYCFIDRSRGRIFIHDGKALNQISDDGMLNFWFDNAQYSDPTKDNPFNGMGYTMAFDEENYRLLITKVDTGEGAFPFTMSYYSIDRYFIAFHDYLPEFMYNNREGIYFINNRTFKLFKGGSQTLKATFIDETVFPSYVDVVFNDKAEVTKRFQTVKWLTELEDSNGVKLEEKTITQLMVYNNNQCSGLLNLEDGKNLWFSRDRKNVEEMWVYNSFRDLIKDVTNPFLDQNNALITSNINNNKVWFKRSHFLSKFVVVRFQYDNVDQNELYIIAVDTNYNISTKGL